MSKLLDQLRRLVEDPPPAYAFELSEDGISFAVRGGKQAEEVHFRPFGFDVLSVSPVKDNMVAPEAFAGMVQSLVPPQMHKKRRDAALILPDYCARIAVLDFDSFPTDRDEQLALVRFRMKKTVPFDMDSAAVNFQQNKTGGKKTEVVVAAAAVEIVAKYEAPFRAAGYQTGYVTTSILASMDLMPPDGLNLCAKLSGKALTVAVCRGRQPKLVRCVELGSFTAEEIMGVLYPTSAYAEDELGERPQRMLTCGFTRLTPGVRTQCEDEMGLPFESLDSIWGPAGETNAGLLGWLQSQEAA